MHQEQGTIEIIAVAFMRQILPLGLSFLIVSLPGAAHAQEPSAALRQADAEYREGVAALNHNDLETARTRFEAVTRLAPTAEQGHSALGAILVRQGQWVAGTRELEKALAIKPNDSDAQLNLAMVYAQVGAPAKAIPLFAKLELLPELITTLLVQQSWKHTRDHCKLRGRRNALLAR